METRPPLADWPKPETAAIITTFKVKLDGLCSINGGHDEKCTIVELSIDRVTVLSSATAKFGDDVILSLPRIGLVKANVAQVLPDGFDLVFEPAIASKLGTYVRWLVRRGRDHGEGREFSRIVPVKKLVILEREGEPESMARIIDLSRSGIAFTTSKVLLEGESVLIGRREAQVTRVFEGGAAAEFATVLPEEGFDEMIDLNALETVPPAV